MKKKLKSVVINIGATKTQVLGMEQDVLVFGIMLWLQERMMLILPI